MAPLMDFDRALREAMEVEPSGDFTARIRTRVAEAPLQSRALPAFGLAAALGVLGVIGIAVLLQPRPVIPRSPNLTHRDLLVIAEPPRIWSSPASQHAPTVPLSTSNVVLSRSEMLALQRLFAGFTTAPPQLEAAPDELAIPEELSIPEIVIEPLVPVVNSPEGERQ